MADPEKEAGDLAEVEAEKQEAEEDTSATEHGESAGIKEEQIDKEQVDETTLPTEQEQNPDSAAYELGATEEQSQGPDAVEEQTTAEEPVQAPDVVEESVQGFAPSEEPTQEQDAVVELATSEEPAQGPAAAEEPTEGLDTGEKQETPIVESQEVQKDTSDVQDFGVQIGPTGDDLGAAISETTGGVDESVPRQHVGFGKDELIEALASEGAKGQERVREPDVTVKFMLHPDIQIFTKTFKINQTVEQIKMYFVKRLKIPLDLLQIMLIGRISDNKETLWDLGAHPYGTIQVDMFSLDEENFPIKAYKLLQEFYMADVITVRVQTDPDTFQNIDVEIKRPTFEKPFLGGFRHKETGIEYHNAGSQTDPKKRPEKGYEEFCRSTQTVFERRKLQQTRNTTSTQMTKIGVYVSNITDKLIEPKTYVTADEYHERRLKATIVIQTYYRRWLAKNLVEKLREQLRLRLEWEEEEERRKQRERAERLLKEYNRRLYPRTKDDFELLYHALELWRQEELERINTTFTGAERKAALCGLLEKEAQLIASIGRHKINADEENQEKAILSFLEKCAAPKRWKAFDGRITEMDTQFTLRARELLEIYRSISMKDLPQDERLDVLLTLKHTVKEHECKLTQEIVELIDREVDLTMRGVKECNLQGLRQRICTLFLQYIKTPFFNPEVARLLKVPPDPMKLYQNIYFCLGCKRYLPSTDFAISTTSHTVGRCRLCCKLDNEARKREAFLKYKRMLRNLRDSEVKYEDGAKVAFIIQQQDLHYMVENFWGSQSALSAWDDLYDLVMVRWNKYKEWSPWNCILLRNEEAEAHLKLKNLEKAYEPVFIHRIKHKHILARNYFSQFPKLAAVLHKDDKPTTTDDLLVTKALTPGPSK
ncbi:IQ and ubiquitin-like domain-containing protein [Sceloporus undulatus]|uniref:IQ and ubiquitin-like domain-containing protein n=1 Tax=Sceloporus undulatus TaxID=8520 RepID=UPI001C4C61CA|nr:IQ and ubiquitin-like domain-containing protein [Sceloporus undulatus]XP_042326579.1 IQ and ubiquitin-like domain-containing protein [Sceloporus undulatus]XP_042326580.1 IQ and ubiquitin-like domain-containing protein [Sceloporus undulatus]